MMKSGITDTYIHIFHIVLYCIHFNKQTNLSIKKKRRKYYAFLLRAYAMVTRYKAKGNREVFFLHVYYIEKAENAKQMRKRLMIMRQLRIQVGQSFHIDTHYIV